MVLKVTSFSDFLRCRERRARVCVCVCVCWDCCRVWQKRVTLVIRHLPLVA